MMQSHKITFWVFWPGDDQAIADWLEAALADPQDYWQALELVKAEQQENEKGPLLRALLYSMMEFQLIKIR